MMGQHLDIWTFIARLLSITDNGISRFHSMMNGPEISRRARLSTLRNNTTLIKDCNRQLVSGSYSLTDYLRRLSHSVQNLVDNVLAHPLVSQIQDGEINGDDAPGSQEGIAPIAEQPALALVIEQLSPTSVPEQPAPARVNIDVEEDAPGANAESHPLGNCTVSFENQITHIVIPCGHFVLCSRCAEELPRHARFYHCPYCRGQIESILRMYLQ